MESGANLHESIAIVTALFFRRGSIPKLPRSDEIAPDGYA